MIVVCLKWVDQRPEVDPLSGEVHSDPRVSGASPADQAALEWALRAAETWDDEVTAVTAGPAGADAVVREALACGATRAVRVDMSPGAPSVDVAAGVAGVALAGGARLVVCGDWSLDRGSGSVPAFVAAALSGTQALGLVSVTFEAGGRITAERRLDGGRRERLGVPAGGPATAPGPGRSPAAAAPVVLSVEAASARLRRATLDGVLAARTSHVDVVAAPPASPAPALVRTAPYRPRARVLPPPAAGLSARERILTLSGALVDRTPPVTMVLEPAAAAEVLLAQLRAWGELP